MFVTHDYLQVREVLDTMRVAARLGSGSLGAYVISMSQAASDVLAVELLQKEARLMVGATGMTGRSFCNSGTVNCQVLLSLLTACSRHSP